MSIEHLDSKKYYLTPNGGFCEGQSTRNALLDVTRTWHSHLNKGDEVFVAFLIMSKHLTQIKPHTPLF